MYPTHLLEWLHEGSWRRIGWDARDPRQTRQLRDHAIRLASTGGAYRIVTDNPFCHAPVIVRERFGVGAHAGTCSEVAAHTPKHRADVEVPR